MKKDIGYLKSTDFTSLQEATEDQDAPTSFEMPLATAKHVHVEDVEADISEVETDEEKLDDQETTIYRDLPNLEEAIVQ